MKQKTFLEELVEKINQVDMKILEEKVVLRKHRMAKDQLDQRLLKQ